MKSIFIPLLLLLSATTIYSNTQSFIDEIRAGNGTVFDSLGKKHTHGVHFQLTFPASWVQSDAWVSKDSSIVIAQLLGDERKQKGVVQIYVFEETPENHFNLERLRKAESHSSDAEHSIIEVHGRKFLRSEKIQAFEFSKGPSLQGESIAAPPVNWQVQTVEYSFQLENDYLFRMYASRTLNNEADESPSEFEKFDELLVSMLETLEIVDL